nr:DUF3289 family protein [Erwinia mallotivora]
MPYRLAGYSSCLTRFGLIILSVITIAGVAAAHAVVLVLNNVKSRTSLRAVSILRDHDHPAIYISGNILLKSGQTPIFTCQCFISFSSRLKYIGFLTAKSTVLSLQGLVMSALQFPYTIYQTQHRFNDYSADDMRYGDLTAKQLRQDFGLDDVSDVVNPWTGEEVSLFSAFRKSRPKSKAETATLLFQEFLRLSIPAYYFGQRQLFTGLVKHFYSGRGKAFSSLLLDMAYREKIISARKNKSSSLYIIEESLKENINWDKGCLDSSGVEVIREALSVSVLPKFNRWKDFFNGMGMSVHDVYATNIQISEIKIDNNTYHAKLLYKGQDHFGLDKKDIMNRKFHYLRAFRIWFVLQRWNGLGFQPFFTNMKTTIEISGERK